MGWLAVSLTGDLAFLAAAGLFSLGAAGDRVTRFLRSCRTTGRERHAADQTNRGPRIPYNFWADVMASHEIPADGLGSTAPDWTSAESLFCNTYRRSSQLWNGEECNFITMRCHERKLLTSIPNDSEKTAPHYTLYVHAYYQFSVPPCCMLQSNVRLFNTDVFVTGTLNKIIISPISDLYTWKKI